MILRLSSYFIEEELPRNPPPEDDWIIDIGTELQNTTATPSSWSICKVPTKLRSVNEDAYTPHAVSIGPFHHGHEKLQPMEVYKRQFLRFLFQRTQKPEEEIRKDCCNNILALDERVRASYAEKIDLDKYKLAKILLYDAGFMLELFFKYIGLRSLGQRNQISIPRQMAVKLQRDLALLENQIPWFVLNSLFDIIKSHIGVAGLPTLEKLALQFFDGQMLNISVETSLDIEEHRETSKHLLHLLHSCYRPSVDLNSTTDIENLIFLPCATSLRQAGVVFQKDTTNDFFHLEFKDGTFKIPPLYIEDDTDSLFRNLVAFEQSQQHSDRYLTSYFMLMDQLIDTEEDVKLLQQKGIIRSDLGQGDDVSTLFNNFGKEVTYEQFHYAELCEKVDAFANSRWQRYIAALRRDYFKNPWSIMSFVAAVILLILTLLQTIYTVSSYYRRR